MMKATLKAVLMICVLAAFASAQDGGEKQSPPGVEVISFDWKYEGYAPVEIVRSGKSAMTTSVKRTTSYVFKYTARANVKNTSGRAIKSIEWDYYFDDPEGGKELRRFHFQSKQQIAPDAALSLTKETLIPPDESTRFITAGKQRVQITRIEFADGTIWRLEDEKKQ
jgi:hypothetical protein